MRLLLTLTLLGSLAFSSAAQTKVYHKYWVELTDKEGTPYSLDRGLEFLSNKAMQRRFDQGIGLDSTDLPVSPVYVDSIESMGVKVFNRSKWFNAVSIETLDTSLLAEIEALGFVKSIEPVAKTIIQEYCDDEPRLKSSVFVDNGPNGENIYGSAFDQIHMLKGDFLHELGYRGEGMEIAVLDAGFNNVDEIAAFDSLWWNQQILGTRDFVEGNDSVFEDGTHGTSVLSTMAANEPGVILGTAPKANYWLLRTEDGSTEYRVEEDNWIAAAEFADSVGVDMINSSLGYSVFDDEAMSYSYSSMDGNTTRITRGADLAASKGILVVTSAGNLGNSAWKYISAPADANEVLAVGALNPDGSVVGFSSRGPTVDGRVKPNVAAQGASVVYVSGNGNTRYGAGTSFASPILAGLTACLWQSQRAKSSKEIRTMIEATASHYSNPNDSIGYGMADFQLAHFKFMEEKGPLYVRNNLPRPYPNPFRDQLSIMFFAETSNNYVLEVFDAVGKRVYVEERYINEGRFSNFNLSSLSGLMAGMYHVRVSSSSSSDLVKVMKL